MSANGNYIFPADPLTLARVIVGCGSLVALTAVAVLGIGTILRRSAGAILVGVVVFVLPTFTGPGIIGPTSSGTAATWLYRVTPAAGFSMLGLLPRSGLVSYPVHDEQRLLPAAAMGGPAGALRICSGCTLRRAGRAAAERRVTDALRAEWTKLRTVAGTWWLMAGAVALTVAASAGDSRVHARIARRPGERRPGSDQAVPDRRRPRPSGRRDSGGAGDQRGVPRRHDPGDPRRDAAPWGDAGRQSRQRRRSRAGDGSAGRRRLPDRRASVAARGRPGPRPWLRPRLDRPRGDAARCSSAASCTSR